MATNKAREEVRNERRHEQLCEVLTPPERSTITNALSVAANRFDEDAKNMRDIATAMRKGERVAMFAAGEEGAKGADRLAEQFEMQAADSRALIEWFE